MKHHKHGARALQHEHGLAGMVMHGYKLTYPHETTNHWHGGRSLVRKHYNDYR